MKKVFLLLLVLLVSCEKEKDLVVDYIEININIQKLLTTQSGFTGGITGKGCTFPETLVPNDLTTYYLTFESLDTGDVQVVEIADGTGSFQFKVYGDNYKLTTTTYNQSLVLPERTDQFHWFSEQIVDLGVSSNIDIILQNPYSAVVVVNNDSSVIPTPILGGQEMYANINGWFIFTKVEGTEELIITKSDGKAVTYVEDFEPTIIYTYMYCTPTSLSISRESQPFITNKQFIFN